MAKKPTTRHPREAEILKYLAETTFPLKRTKRVIQRAESLLEFYAKHRRLMVKEAEDKGLYLWQTSARLNALQGRISPELLGLFELFGIELKFNPRPKRTRKKGGYATRRTVNPDSHRGKPVPKREPAHSSPSVLLMGEMKLRQEARTALRKLAPEGFSPRPGEDLGETVWWLRLWQWLHLEPGDKVEPELKAFMALQDRLIAEKALSKNQLDLLKALREEDPVKRKPK
jgi:hypothetical protein